MATYVMSDIHGEYRKYLLMLEKIGFKPSDTLFIIGDVVDRGPEPVTLLRDMMERSNVFPIMGNHDLIAHYNLRNLCREVTEELLEAALGPEEMNSLIDWIHEGGQTTIEGFQKLDHQQRADVLDYIHSFTLYEAIDVGERTFVLVHAGLGNFRPDKKLREYALTELLEDRLDPERQYFDDPNVFLVVGHTPTPYFWGKPQIYHSHNNICIDCGACSPHGRLACLCLETMEEFYV